MQLRYARPRSPMTAPRLSLESNMCPLKQLAMARCSITRRPFSRSSYPRLEASSCLCSHGAAVMFPWRTNELDLSGQLLCISGHLDVVRSAEKRGLRNFGIFRNFFPTKLKIGCYRERGCKGSFMNKFSGARCFKTCTNYNGVGPANQPSGKATS